MSRVPRHPCARCGKKQSAERMIYSRFSGNRYCTDLEGCARRVKNRGRRKGAVEGA